MKHLFFLTLTAAVPTLEFPALKMTAAAATKLGEVVVTGQKATVVEELGKRVINVEKDLGSVGGTAANVLQNVPSVSVDVNGTVSMRGTSNLTILIDGKPAGVPCVQLDAQLRCLLFGKPERPTVCLSLRPEALMCGISATQAHQYLAALERATQPAARIRINVA